MQAKFVPGGFFLFVSGCTWKSTGVYMQRSVYARWRLRDTWRSRGSAFLNSKRLSSFSSTLSDERCSNLSFESPNQNPKNRTLNSHRDTRGTRCVLWEVTMYGHLPLMKLGFLPVPLWPIFLLKCSLGRAMLQPEFRWSKPDEKHPKQSKTETRKTAFRSSKTLKSYAGDGPAAAGCPVTNPDNNCANGLLAPLQPVLCLKNTLIPLTCYYFVFFSGELIFLASRLSYSGALSWKKSFSNFNCKLLFFTFFSVFTSFSGVNHTSNPGHRH